MHNTRSAIASLVNRYKAVLKKCHLLNTFGSLALATSLVTGAVGVVGTVDFAHASDDGTAVMSISTTPTYAPTLDKSNIYTNLIEGELTTLGKTSMSGGESSTWAEYIAKTPAYKSDAVGYDSDDAWAAYMANVKKLFGSTTVSSAYNVTPIASGDYTSFTVYAINSDTSTLSTYDIEKTEYSIFLYTDNGATVSSTAALALAYLGSDYFDESGEYVGTGSVLENILDGYTTENGATIAIDEAGTYTIKCGETQNLSVKYSVNSSSSTTTVADNDVVYYDANSGDTIGDIDSSYIGEDSTSNNGGAIYIGATSADRTAGAITGDFIGNYVKNGTAIITNNGGAIYVYSKGTDVEVSTGKITGDFIGNSASNSAYRYAGNGGAISLMSLSGTTDSLATSKIDEIEGDFIGNSATTTLTLNNNGGHGGNGGAIHLYSGSYAESSIGDITGDFIGNSAYSTNTYKYSYSGSGGAIYLYAVDYSTSSIEDITGNFIGKYCV
ncbi:MAG: hypothetical protein R3Y11_02910 [Pseudomonadota bacterium]